jgi:hypothetical protein
MIPEFPRFKRLEVGDQLDVEAMTSAFPPYSDFNFVSLWCWNIDGSCAVSRLHDNFVVRLNDYLTNAPLYSFLGVNAVEATVSALLSHAEREGVDPRLRLVPEDVIEAADGLADEFEIVEDPGSADYVLSVDEWVGLEGGKFLDKRKYLRRIERDAAPVFSVLNVRDIEVQQKIMRVFGFWIVQRQRAGLEETFNEAVAVRRFFALRRDDDLHGFSVEIGGVMQAFALVEGVNDGYLVGHFWKADLAFPGIYVYLLHHMSRYFSARGYHSFNIEQDLGKDGLAQSKRRLRPYRYLRKYEIAARQTACITQRYCPAESENAVRS